MKKGAKKRGELLVVLKFGDGLVDKMPYAEYERKSAINRAAMLSSGEPSIKAMALKEIEEAAQLQASAIRAQDTARSNSNNLAKQKAADDEAERMFLLWLNALPSRSRFRLLPPAQRLKRFIFDAGISDYQARRFRRMLKEGRL